MCYLISFVCVSKYFILCLIVVVYCHLILQEKCKISKWFPHSSYQHFKLSICLSHLNLYYYATLSLHFCKLFQKTDHKVHQNFYRTSERMIMKIYQFTIHRSIFTLLKTADKNWVVALLIVTVLQWRIFISLTHTHQKVH
jgi:hypothetical protein